MHLVLDLQVLQDEEISPDLALQAIDLALELAGAPCGNKVTALLNGAKPRRLHALQQKLRRVLPPQAIVLWHAPPPQAAPSETAAAAALIRAATIMALAPDILLLGSGALGITSWPTLWQSPVTITLAELLDLAGRSGQASWDVLARHTAGSPGRLPASAKQLKLALLGPLPPDPTGVADATASVLPALRRHYDITLFVPEPDTVAASLRAAFPVQPTAAFVHMAGGFDRILYQLGNSPFHHHPAILLGDQPGVVLLHDTMLGDLTAYLAGENITSALFTAEGWPGHVCLAERGLQAAILAHGCLAPLLREQLGAIVHSAFGIQQVRAAADVPVWQAPLPMLYGAPGQPALPTRRAARTALGITEDTMLVVCLGGVTPAKCPDILVDGFERAFASNGSARLVFVGDLLTGSLPTSSRAMVSLSGRVTPEAWRHWLAAADIAVQLRRHSRGETSGAVMDSMAAGLPTIANAHGPMAELPPDAVLLLAEVPTPDELALALQGLAKDAGWRQRLGAAGRRHVVTAHAPERAAAGYAAAIEAAYALPSGRVAADMLLRGLATSSLPAGMLAQAVAATMPMHGIRRLLVDVSIVAKKDSGTGIQRVTREITRRLLTRHVPGWRVEALRGDTRELQLAREWAAGLLRVPCPAPDELAEAGAGDRILLLDFPGMIEGANMQALQLAQARGAEVVFVLYDLLPILHPEWFPTTSATATAAYQRALLGFVDQVICISRSVAQELHDALATGEVRRARALEIGWFHLGSDFRDDVAGAAPPAAVRVALAAMARSRSLLMVGTVEPRKGHAQALAAFELLWAAGQHVVLVVAGTQGWMTETVCAELATHPENGRRLHWLRHPSDNDLAALYKASTGLLAASLGEGFGLPLVEASRIGKPILARDIPVFREVTSGYAYWFTGEDAASLAAAVSAFLLSAKTSTLPPPQAASILSWDESTAQLFDQVMGDAWPMRWEPAATPALAG
jgi:glycosyltransferase involved in cell wall biosynthesis